MEALKDMARLDKGIARRIKQEADRLAETGTGNVKSFRELIKPSSVFAWATIACASTTTA